MGQSQRTTGMAASSQEPDSPGREGLSAAAPSLHGLGQAPHP